MAKRTLETKHGTIEFRLVKVARVQHVTGYWR